MVRSRSESYSKRIRDEKKGEEDMLRLLGENDKNKLLTEALSVLGDIKKMQKQLDQIDKRFIEQDKLKTQVDTNTSNCEIAYKEVQQHDKIIKNQEIRLARIEKSGVSVSTTAAPPHDFSEYLMMLDRSTVSRSSISSVAKNVEFLVPVDMIKLFEVNSKEVALNDKANTFEISGKKILIYFLLFSK